MAKLWKQLRGYKRQAGALVMFAAVILPTFGIDIPDELMRQITVIGSLIFGIGWLDKGGVWVSDKMKEVKK